VVRAGAVWHDESVRTPLLWILSLAVLVQEPLAQVGDLGSVLTAEPALLAGLALQLPAGLIALWLIRALLRVALGLGPAPGSRQAARLLLARTSFAFASSPFRPAVLASRHAGRAPPLPA
jgi:hypothetical protein